MIAIWADMVMNENDSYGIRINCPNSYFKNLKIKYDLPFYTYFNFVVFDDVSFSSHLANSIIHLDEIIEEPIYYDTANQLQIIISGSINDISKLKLKL